MAHIILYTGYWLKGEHKHVVSDESNLAAPEDSFFNDRTRSFVILNGNWQLFRDINCQNPFPHIYGPGVYELADVVGVPIDTVSSLRATTQPATMHGDTPPGYVTLFEHAAFHGDHRHRFTSTPSLTDSDLPPFNDMVSSLIVSRFGVAHPHLQLCSDINYGLPYGKVLGTGAFDFVGNYGLPNDDLSSFELDAGPGEPPGTVHGDESFGEIILFEHENFRSRHRHVYLAEPDLGAADDNHFARIASSMYIDRGAWALCREPNCQQIMPAWDLSGFGQSPGGPGFNWNQLKAPKFFLPGAYPSLRAVGVDNDAVMSLHMPLPDIYFWYTGQFQSGSNYVDNLWIITVTGPHAPGGVTLNAGLFATSDQSQNPPLREIGSYVDAAGHAWAHAYCINWNYGAGETIPFEVSCTTQGAFGSAVKTSRASWTSPGAPAPPPQVVVPNEVGKNLYDAAQDLANLGLLCQPTPPGIVVMRDYKVASQNPTAGTSVAPQTTVYLNCVPVPPPVAGYSVIHVYNSNTDGTAYDIWTQSNGNLKKDGTAQPGTQPFNVTLPQGPVVLYAMPVGESPQNGQYRAKSSWPGDPKGPGNNWNIQ